MLVYKLYELNAMIITSLNLRRIMVRLPQQQVSLYTVELINDPSLYLLKIRK